MTLQDDGKILLVGESSLSFAGGTGYDFGIVRLDADGSLDDTFHAGGVVLTDFTCAMDHIDEAGADVAIQPDGKIVVAGYADDGVVWDSPTWGEFALARYNPDGSRDASFGADGVVSDAFGASQVRANAVAIQDDGKIVVGGHARFGYPGSGLHWDYFDFAVARYHPDGTRDTSFGSNGLVTTDLGLPSNDYPCDFISDIAIQPDGKIVAVGSTGFNGRDLAIARYEPDGSLDAAFGTGGTITYNFGASSASGNGLVIQDDGRIVVVGYLSLAGSPTGADMLVARLNEDGSLDTSFDSDGFASIDFGAMTDVASDIAFPPGGKILVGGRADHVDTSRDFALVLLESDGSLDTTVGILPWPGTTRTARSMRRSAPAERRRSTSVTVSTTTCMALSCSPMGRSSWPGTPRTRSSRPPEQTSPWPASIPTAHRTTPSATVSGN
jgi:uncharacterized delta-60 repeat protein